MKNNSKPHTNIARLVCILSLAVLSACEETDQDEGIIVNTLQVFNGLAIDGQIARATVYLDNNNNGTRDPWEAFAFTDNDGYYSVNPLTNTDYCQTGASAEQAQYCLRSNRQYDNVVVRIDAGYDITTGEPFFGQMSRRIDTQLDDISQSLVISPFTSLFTNIISVEEKSRLLLQLDMEEWELNTNYLNTDGLGSIDGKLLKNALKVHKIVSVLADRLHDGYPNIGEEVGTPNDVSFFVYPELATQLLNSGNHMSVTLTDSLALTRLLDQSEKNIRTLFQSREISLPPDMGSTTEPAGFERVVAVSQVVGNVIDTVFTPATTLNINEVLARVRLVEVVTLKGINEKNIDQSINNLQNFISASDRTLSDSLLLSLSQQSFDITALARNDFAGDDFDSIEEIQNAAKLPVEATPFSRISGSTFKVSDLDMGASPNNLKDSEVEFYFQGDPSDTEGAFKACVKYIDGASIDGALGDGNTRGELINGFWSLLGVTSTQTQSFSLLLTIEFLGTTYQAIVKPNGQETLNGLTYQTVRFDNGGAISTYHSEEGLVTSGTLPQSNAQCQDRLPSRVGI